MDNTHFCRCVDDKYVEWGSVDFTLVLSFLQVSSVGCQNARMPLGQQRRLGCPGLGPQPIRNGQIWRRSGLPNPRLRSPQLPPEICLSILDFVGDRAVDTSMKLSDSTITLILCWTWKYETSEKISLQPGLLPILKTLVIVASDQWEIPNFCSAFAGHRFSSTLSCIRIWIMVRAPAGGKEYDLLDDTLAVLPSRIRIEIGSHYWSYLPKLKSKGVLVVPSVPYGA
ncbi:hypothetical protein ABKN59_001194 [Abortiporus biennis]